MSEDRPKHSPLGASGAERWLNCPGSVTLLKTLKLPESDEPDYRREGTAGHEAAAHCLQNGVDAWEIIGQRFYETEIDVEMADAIQVYLDTVRPLMVPTAKVLIEQHISSDEHPQFYGTVDCATIADSLLTVTDLKMGKGVMVEVEHNPQIMYYAYGILVQHPDVRRCVLRIVQPRAFHPDGPVRRWEISAEELAEWAHRELFPAMHATAFDQHLDAGKWCKFCPAKLVCPTMTGLFKAAMNADAKETIELTDEYLGRSYQYIEAVEQYVKAFKEETYRRLNSGHVVPGTKLVYKKANRVFKAEAEAVLLAKYGDKCYKPPTFKSPAEIEKIDGEAVTLVREYAYTPQTGLTVALDKDKRPAVKVEPTQAIFGEAVKALEAGA